MSVHPNRNLSRRRAGLAAALGAAVLLPALAACQEHPTYRGALEGMRATSSSAVVTDAFFARLESTSSAKGRLADTSFAAEAYDATVIVALATLAAGSDGVELAGHIVDVTRSGTECDSFAACKQLLESGSDIAYVGASGARPLDEAGEPQAAIFSLSEFGADDRLDAARRRVLGDAVAAPTEPVVQPVDVTREGDGVLSIAALLPITGRGSIYLGAIRAGYELAQEDINAAGGVLGQPVRFEVADSGDATMDVGRANATTLIAGGADAIIGPASSEVALDIIEPVTSAGVVLFSPSNTAPELSSYPDHGLYFRNVPSDLLQGEALAQVIAAEGSKTAFVLAIDDPYGRGLEAQLRTSLDRLGVKVVGSTLYDPKLTDYFSTVAPLRDVDPDAVILVSFSEASRVLRALVVSGFGPRQRKVFGADGTVSNAIGEQFNAGR